MKTTYYSHTIEVFQSDDHDKRFIIHVDGSFISTKPCYTHETAISAAKEYIKSNRRKRA